MKPSTPSKNPPSDPGWYWYQDREDKPLEVVLVERNDRLLPGEQQAVAATRLLGGDYPVGILCVRRLLGTVQSAVPLAILGGFWWGEAAPPPYAPPAYPSNRR